MAVLVQSQVDFRPPFFLDISITICRYEMGFGIEELVGGCC